jgi:hypothetical protein
MDDLESIKAILRQPTFRWLPKHLNHLAEHIKFDNRNISFLAINALFRSDDYHLERSIAPFENHYLISGYVAVQKKDLLRTRAEFLTVIFYLDKHHNIVPVTAYSQSDDENEDD